MTTRMFQIALVSKVDEKQAPNATHSAGFALPTAPRYH
jgi:hypothetical protein